MNKRRPLLSEQRRSQGVMQTLRGTERRTRALERAGVSEATTTAGAAIASLVNNTGATADNTVAAVTDPADTPASADALRDDLVANVIPGIEANFSDITAKLNEVIEVLRAAGLVQR